MNKKLTRVHDGKMICGVCAGIARYFDIDPTVVRLGAVILACFGGGGILAYIVAAVIMPVENNNIVVE